MANLDSKVDYSDIQELFSQVGELQGTAVHYGRYGKSLGTAEVTFAQYPDAVKAVERFQGFFLKGQPMQIHPDGVA